MSGLKQVAGFVVPKGVYTCINAGYYVVRYGPLALVGNDVVMVLQLLVGLAAKLNLLPLLKSTPQDFFGGLYYTMGEHVGERGKAPELERLEHMDRGEVPTPDRAQLLRLRHLVRLLFSTNLENPTPTDAQRLFKQVLPGSELLLGEMSVTAEIPSYFLVCTRQEKAAYLVLPGTRNVADIATDVNAEEEPLLGGCAHKGMVASARWLLGELKPILVHLYTHGYRITIVGHSLGGAVGALLTMMLRPDIASLSCVGFGMPACVDERLIPATIDCIVSVVNRDDFVPRLSVQNVEALCHSTLCPGQVAKTKAWMDEDWKAVQDYKRILELRRRSEAASGVAPASTAEADGSPTKDEKVSFLVDAGLTKAAATRCLELEEGDVTRALLRGTEEEHDAGNESPESATADGPPKGAVQSSASTAATTSDQQQSTEQIQGARFLLGRLASVGADAGERIRAWSSEAATQVGSRASAAAVSAYGEEPQGAKSHTRFFIPGTVIHIYNQNGLGRAALCPSTSEIFARINLCKNMVSNHKVSAYDAALRQACILDSDVKTPQWESFEDRETCACCGADFNWAYVLQSSPQRMLARHHCFKCGRVVCDGCSQTRQAWPQLGFASNVATCDACVFGPDSDEVPYQSL